MLTNKTVKRWQCSKRTCKAFVKTQESDDTIVQSVLDHNHEKLSDEVFNRHFVSNSVKRKGVEDICEKPLKLIRNEIKNSAVEALTTKDIVDIMGNINPTELNVKVSKANNTRDSGILIGCSKNEDSSKFKDAANAKLSDAYEVKEIKSRNPKIRIVVMIEKHEPDELISLLKYQNDVIQSSRAL
ncbi:unnamed protein product [Psylliodes chrysocephalus]|uniref:FLYWCH-type domain-containing protein n=1 Tax=Psylliodes chrysocephalus TaxID=3402493 RepID=A0A9P0GB52_9CUCU|nr:unnamed protein product [Psylliodes chrysocephala]